MNRPKHISFLPHCAELCFAQNCTMEYFERDRDDFCASCQSGIYLKKFNFILCQFGIVPFRHIKVKNFGPYMPNWHSSPYRLTQSRILALILKIYRCKGKVPRNRILVL